ncbi:FAD-dependent oxidoreductase, partial [Clostridium saudiense]|nr:FAD-dependent oxidoreductase [Clostridium saudiense]
AIKQRTGENEIGGSYDALRRVAKDLYPKSKEKYIWSAQDCMTIDGIPYIGKYSDETPNIYVATGFNKWGMTSSMVSAMIISDMILGKENDFSEIFSPKRFDLSASINNVAKDISETAKNFIAQKISIPSSTIEHIKNGHAGIVEYNGEKVGVYKNNEGKEFIVSTKCPHLGCQLHWNADELTWDCPCHGSRFDYEGRLIGGPATKDLVD